MRFLDTTRWSALLLTVVALNACHHEAPFATQITSMEYPRLAALAQISGTVVLRVRIDSAGEVLSATGRSGHPILIKAAEANIKLWRFSAGRSSGQKAESEIDFTYVFELKGVSDAPRPCSGLTYEYPNRVTITSEAPLVMP